MFKITEGTLYQRDFRILPSIRIAEYVCSDDCYEELTAEDTLIVISRDSRIFELNIAGSIILEGIQFSETPEIIVNTLERVFDAPTNVLRTQLDEFTSELLQGHFIKRL